MPIRTLTLPWSTKPSVESSTGLISSTSLIQQLSSLSLTTEIWKAHTIVFEKGAYFYEEVWRIPLIIRTPNTSPAIQDTFVSLLDVGQTLFSLINDEGLTDPAREGRNLLPLVGTSRRPPDWEQSAYGVYYRYNGYSFEVRAIRNERFKYVWNPQDINELYDLDNDPHEMTNLANHAKTRTVEQNLHTQLISWLNQIGDDLPDGLDLLLPAGTIVATGEQGP